MNGKTLMYVCMCVYVCVCACFRVCQLDKMELKIALLAFRMKKNLNFNLCYSRGASSLILDRFNPKRDQIFHVKKNLMKHFIKNSLSLQLSLLSVSFGFSYLNFKKRHFQLHFCIFFPLFFVQNSSTIACVNSFDQKV